MTCEANIWAAFDNWLSLTVEHDFYIVAVSHPKLLRCDHEHAIPAISDEERRAARAKHNDRVGALIHCALIMIIVNIEIALIAVDDPELLATKRSTTSEP